MNTKEIPITDEDGRNYNCKINTIPDVCPLCNYAINPSFCYSHYTRTTLQLVFLCPRQECQRLFIGRYSPSQDGSQRIAFLRDLAPITFQKRDFSGEILNISVSFTKIYNEALQAEKLGLAQISGPGYGKALEFLIKDYAISREKDASKQDEIKKKLLSRVIKDHVSDSNIRTTAGLAAWLRNDETHYIRIWNDMDINDLKLLIELTVRWIESEEMTLSYKSRMSSPSAQ